MKSRYLFVSFILAAFMLLLGAGIAYKSYRDAETQKQAKKAAVIEQVKVTLIEGWNSKEMGQALTKQSLISEDLFSRSLKNFNLSSFKLIQNTKPKNTTLEGFLFPDTYLFAKNSTPEEIINKILENFEKRINSLDINTQNSYHVIPGYEDLTLSINDAPGLTLYQVLILASIVEKESGGAGITAAELNEQRAIIAGIFYNRLKKGIALQSDATVNYVTGKTNASASLEDLKVNSPYNTYKYAGLPPGPICNPSLASIKAVLFPKKTDYYYFLHKQPSGQVLYSRTFEEHVSKK